MRERRKVPRYLLGLSGRLHPAGERMGTNVVVRVISTLGCEIEGAEGPGVGKKCELYIDWRDMQIGVEARVVRRDREGRMGLKFLPADKNTQQRLSDLCAALRLPPSSVPLPQLADTALSVLDSATTRPPTRAEPPLATEPSEPPRRARRRLPRYICELPARLTNPATGVTSSVTLVTLSVLGSCIEGPGLPVAGQRCELNSEWRGRPFRLQCDVVWKSKQERVGVKFRPPDEETEKLLRQVCANLRLQPMAPLPDVTGDL